VGGLAVNRAGVTLAGERAGEGIPIVLAHGLTATRRYVVMRSRTLERSGHDVVTYDARGHGQSDPALSPGEYDYVNLAADLAAVLDELELERAVLAGSSMGAHTALRLALDEPQRVIALALITPGYDPATVDDPERLVQWDALSEGLRGGGVEGFLAAFEVYAPPGRWRDTVLRAVRQRMASHEHPGAVADALRVVPRARPFARWEDLDAIEAPTVVVASHDEADPEHPYALAERYASTIPNALLVSEEPGESPLAWQGGRLSKVIAELASTAAREGRGR
jgi:pimeloyl-ACP methyl ester carboxylesterase